MQAMETGVCLYEFDDGYSGRRLDAYTIYPKDFTYEQIDASHGLGQKKQKQMQLKMIML